jgi:hypothetical protein
VFVDNYFYNSQSLKSKLVFVVHRMPWRRCLGPAQCSKWLPLRRHPRPWCCRELLGLHHLCYGAWGFILELLGSVCSTKWRHLTGSSLGFVVAGGSPSCIVGYDSSSFPQKWGIHLVGLCHLALCWSANGLLQACPLLGLWSYKGACAAMFVVHLGLLSANASDRVA